MSWMDEVVIHVVIHVGATYFLFYDALPAYRNIPKVRLGLDFSAALIWRRWEWFLSDSLHVNCLDISNYSKDK